MTATVNDCSPSLQRKQQQQADVPSGSPSLPPLSPTTRSADKDYTQYWYTPVYTSLLGASIGTAAGAWRGHSTLLLALHLGIGYGVFGATFSSTLYGLQQLRGEEGTMNWVGAGAAAGAVTSLITAGPKQVVRGAFFFGGVGSVAESVCDIIGNSITEYKDKRARQRFGQPTTPPAWGGNKGLE